MNQREKILAGGVVLLIVAWGGSRLWNRYQGAVDARAEALVEVKGRLDLARLEAHKAQAALGELDEFQSRSLPSERNVARSEYRAWLIEQLVAAGLTYDDVKSTPGGRTRGDAYEALTFTADAVGDLSAVTRFLYAFYHSNQLHKVTLLKLTPMEGGAKVRLGLTVEALIVPGTPRATGLAAGESDRLTLASEDAYISSVVGRNIFQEYVPPPPPRPVRPPVVRRDPPPRPAPPKFDDAKYAYVTGIVGSGDSYQAWVTVRTTGEVLRLRAGDPLKVGELSAMVERVTSNSLVLSTEDGTYTIELRKDKSLRDAVTASDETL
ncbi:hypothetical protein Pla175_33770 [Pirellulimonas nuda]|uniref:Pilus assembly protein, PilO n=1 Tax=Pirellulimonas nuda TaxID=2528009 RepID=A0A518DES4_9BACT|nr:hypothetical protein [Pirellulimonas nuda]QDU89978.1 hypothetical protein Pla175_33770 [Pirellulimonas nuda]